MRVIGLVVLLAPAVGFAQPGAPTPPPAVAPAAAPAAAPPAIAPPGTVQLLERAAAAPGPAVGIARRVAEDAAAGRSFFTETALTAPAGSVAVGLRMPVAPVAEVQLRYAITDRLEVGVSGVTLLATDADADADALGLHAKGQIWRSGSAAIAVGLARYQLTERGADAESVTIPTVAASACLDGADCLAMVTVSLNGLVVTDESDVPVFAGVGWALGRQVQLVGELNLSSDAGDSVTFGYLGVRAGSGQVSVDAGVGFGVEGASSAEAFPFLGVAVRR